MVALSGIRVILIAGLIALAACEIPSGPTEVRDSQLDSSAARIWVGQFLNLAVQIDGRTISDEQFAQQLGDLVTTIDSTSGGVQSLRQQLEPIAGRSIPSVSSSLPRPWLPGHLDTVWARLRQSAFPALQAQANQSLWDRIKNSIAFKQLEAFVTTVIFQAGVPEPGSSILQVAQPETFVVLSQVTVATHIKDAQYSGRIDVLKASELLQINTTNPYDAERQLLSAQGRPIPGWLQPAPSACTVNCTTLAGRFRGTFDNSGTISRTFPETVCTWTLRTAGNADLNLTVNNDNTVSGTVTMAGTSTATVLSGGSSARRCDPGGGSFNDTQSVSGSIYRIRWTTDLGGSRTWTGTFNGQLVRNQVTGTVAVAYSLGTVSSTLRLTLDRR